MYVHTHICTHTHKCTKRVPESLSEERTSHLGAFLGLLELFRCLLGAYVCMDVCTGPPFFVCFQQKMMMSWNCPSNCRSEQAPRGPETRREPQRGTETHREAKFEGGTLSFRVRQKNLCNTQYVLSNDMTIMSWTICACRSLGEVSIPLLSSSDQTAGNDTRDFCAASQI